MTNYPAHLRAKSNAVAAPPALSGPQKSVGVDESDSVRGVKRQLENQEGTAEDPWVVQVWHKGAWYPIRSRIQRSVNQNIKGNTHGGSILRIITGTSGRRHLFSWPDMVQVDDETRRRRSMRVVHPATGKVDGPIGQPFEDPSYELQVLFEHTATDAAGARLFEKLPIQHIDSCNLTAQFAKQRLNVTNVWRVSTESSAHMWARRRAMFKAAKDLFEMSWTGGPMHVQTLFHGTGPEQAVSIARGGFMMRRPTHGRACGNGVYFSSDPAGAAAYSSCDASLVKYMLVADVLVGPTEPATRFMHGPSGPHRVTGMEPTSEGPAVYVVWPVHLVTHIVLTHVVEFKHAYNPNLTVDQAERAGMCLDSGIILVPASSSAVVPATRSGSRAAAAAAAAAAFPAGAAGAAGAAGGPGTPASPDFDGVDLTGDDPDGASM